MPLSYLNIAFGSDPGWDDDEDPYHMFEDERRPNRVIHAGVFDSYRALMKRTPYDRELQLRRMIPEEVSAFKSLASRSFLDSVERFKMTIHGADDAGCDEIWDMNTGSRL